MSRSWRAVIGILVLLGSMALATEVVLAGTQGSDCPGDTSKVRLWENIIGDTSDNNDSLWECSQIANLSTVSHTLPGDCHSSFFNSATWNDCVSSYTCWTPAGVWIHFYGDSNFSNEIDARQCSGALAGHRFDIPVNDALTSFRWENNP